MEEKPIEENASGKTNINVNVTVAGTPPIIVRQQPGCLVQVFFFVFIGWWLGGLAVSTAYLLFLTILGIPLGVMILNKIPYLMALRETEPVISYLGSTVVQHNLIVRTLWFLLAGFWLAALWLSLAYILACTIIGMPVSFWMFDKTPALLTLRRN